MKIYVASSWRCEGYPPVVTALRAAGHEVYDFRNPAPGNVGFGWKQITSRKPSEWSPEEYLEVLASERAREGFEFDMTALRECDACVLVLPCGRSAHLELGWAAGAGKKTIVLLEGAAYRAWEEEYERWKQAVTAKYGCHDPAVCQHRDMPPPPRVPFEPELMYLMCTKICVSLEDAISELEIES